MFKRLIILFLLTFSIASCKEDDLSGENPALGSENVIVATSFLYNNEIFHKDSVITNSLGNRFFIEEIKILVGSFYLVNNGLDTIKADNPFMVSRSSTDAKPMRLNPGGYSARPVVQIGLDSLQSVEARTSNQDEDSPLRDPDISRVPGLAGIGYNHLVITGRVIDEANPDDSTGTIPMHLQVGTEELADVFIGEPFNFSVNTTRDAKFVLSIDIGPALDTRDLAARPIVVSDPTNAADFNAATEIQSNTIIKIF